MADSFALSPQGQVVIQQPREARGVQTSLDGGGATGVSQARGPNVVATNFQGIQDASMKTLEALNKLTEGALKPVVDQMEKENYYQGMAKVVQGQTLQEVEKSDPWYMNIMGPSATVRGAQAMTATTAVQQAQTEFMQSMPELRTKSPDEVRGYLVSQASRIGSTGDPMVDTLVQSKIAEGWGPMLSAHTKEHLAWQQEDMSDRYVNANVTQGGALQALPRGNQPGFGVYDTQKAQTDAIEQAMPLPGMSRDAWQATTAKAFRANLEAGNFAWYETMKGSHVWDNLDPKLREDLEDKQKMYFQRALLNNPATSDLMKDDAGFAVHVQSGSAGQISSLDQLDQLVAKQNEQYAKTTGSSQPRFDNAAVAQMHEQWLKGTEQHEKAVATLADKHAAELDKLTATGNLTREAVINGKPYLIKREGISEDAIRDTMDDIATRALTSNDPGAATAFFSQMATVSSEPKLRPQVLTSTMNLGVQAFVSGTGDPSPQQKEALTYAKALYKSGPQGWASLVDYLGADNAAKAAQVIDSGVDFNDPKGMGMQRDIIKGQAMMTIAPMTKEERDGVHSAVGKMDRGWMSRLFNLGDAALGTVRPTQESMDHMADVAAPQAAALARSRQIPLDQATNAIMSQLVRNADFVDGAVVMQPPKQQGDISMHTALARMGWTGSQTGENYQASFRAVIDTKLKSMADTHGGDMENFDPKDFVVRGGDQLVDGSLSLHLSKKGSPYEDTVIQVRPNEVYDSVVAYDKAISEARQKKAQAEAAAMKNLPRSPYGDAFTERDPAVKEVAGAYRHLTQ